MKWWAQLYLINVPKVIAGFRNETGIVHRMEEFTVEELPKIASVRYTYILLVLLLFNQ